MPPATARSPDADLPFRAAGEGKLAGQIARQLEEEIITAGWPVGQRLGNEESLVERFGASRWVVREAIAITERDGMTQRLRGRLGGVVVAAPAGDVVAAAMRNYLLLVGIRSRDLMTVFQVLEPLVFERAAARRDVATQRALQALQIDPDPVADEFQVMLHTTRAYRGLLQLTRDPALQVFALAASHLLVAWSAYLGSGTSGPPIFHGIAQRTWTLRRSQIEALAQGNAAKAVTLGRTLGREWRGLLDQWEEQHALGAGVLPLDSAQRLADQIAALSDPPRAPKRVDTLTLQLQHTLLASGLRPGDPLAPEGELLQRYGVGRGVLREAIRSLERHGFVRAVEGRHGGLRVGQPSPGSTVRQAVLYFTFLKPASSDLQRLAQALEEAAVSLCTRSGRDEQAMARLAAVPQEGAQSTASLRQLGGRYYRAFAAATGNRVLEMMLNILGSLYTLGDDAQDERAGSDALRAKWLSAAGAAVEALQRRDAARALAEHQRLRQMGELFRFRRRSVEELLAGPLPG